MLSALALGAVIKATAAANTELTVYNGGFALVKDTRTLDLKQGIMTTVIADVAQQIEANSVGIRSLGDKDAFTVLEQSYKFDLIGVNAILSKAVGGYVRLHRTDNNGQDHMVRGKLLSAPTTMVSDENGNQSQVYNGMVIQLDSGEIMLNPEGTVEVESLPSGLVSTPSLVWTLDSNKNGSQPIELSYLTQGINWKSDYVLSLDKDGQVGTLKGWVTVTNHCGTTFNDAKLKLLAGEVNRAPTGVTRHMARGALMDMSKAAAEPTEEQFGEYHLYTVQRPTTIANNEIKQVSLLEATGIHVRKLLLMDSMSNFGTYYPSEDTVGTGPIKPTVYLQIDNKKENGMGMPLPAGTFKVFQTSLSGSLEMLGEDSITHTPRDETIKLHVGQAFDVVGERKRLTFTRLGPNRVRETFSVEVRNRKDTPSEVTIWERHWGDHTITDESQKGTWLDANTLQYVVDLAPNEVKTISYTIETKW